MGNRVKGERVEVSRSSGTTFPATKDGAESWRQMVSKSHNPPSLFGVIFCTTVTSTTSTSPSRVSKPTTLTIPTMNTVGVSPMPLLGTTKLASPLPLLKIGTRKVTGFSTIAETLIEFEGKEQNERYVQICANF